MPTEPFGKVWKFYKYTKYYVYNILYKLKQAQGKFI